MNRTRILLVSGGSLVGQNVLDVLADRRAHVELVATNSVADGPFLFDFDAVYLTPETARASAAFEARFSEILDREKPDLVIPCRDDDVAFLADYKDRRPDRSRGFLCGNRFTAEATCDKWLSWQFAAERGLPFVPTLLTPAAQADGFAREHGFPLVVKPRRGFASRGVYFVFNSAQLQRAAARDGQVIQKHLGDPSKLQAYLRDIDEIGVPLFHSFHGVTHSINVFIAPDGSPAGNFCSRNMNRNGTTNMRLERCESDEAKTLGERCIRAFADAGWRGPMNIQCKETPDRSLVICEFNGRMGGGTAARALLGYDEVDLALRTFVGKAATAEGAPHRAAPAVVRRTIDTVPESGNVARLEHDRHWRREA